MSQYVSSYYGLHQLRIRANRCHHRFWDEGGCRIIVRNNSLNFLGGSLDLSDVSVLRVYNLIKISSIEAPLYGISFPYSADCKELVIGVEYTGGIVTIEEILANEVAHA